MDVIYFANKGVNHQHQKTRRGIPRDSPRPVSNLPGPLPITSCVKTYETYEVELWWLLLLADVFRRQNVEVRFCLENFIVWSLDMSWEFHWQLDNTLFCETIYDDIALFLRLFCHIQKGKRVTTERWFMLKIVQSIFYPMPSGNGNISIDLFLMRLVRWGVMLTMR